MRHVLRTLALLSALMVAGCNGVSLIDPAKPQVMGDITVMPQVKWNQINTDHKLWTQNGDNLDSLHFYTGIKPGQPLFRVAGLSRDQMPVFDPKMLPNDVQDLVVASLQKQGYQNMRPGNLGPCPFGSVTGFCFNLTFATGGGLEMRGRTLVRKRDTQLDVIVFAAPAEYYYGEYDPTVARVFAGIQAK